MPFDSQTKNNAIVGATNLLTENQAFFLIFFARFFTGLASEIG